jgi:hypothetical protein
MFDCTVMSLLNKESECSLDSFVLTGLVEQSALQYVGFKAVEATIDEKTEILFLGQLYDTIFYYYVHNTFQFLAYKLFIFHK